jgi:ethanolaminephosphotransferase
MDGIVRVIYEAMESKDHLKSTVLVVCGDHGMNDAGNHGASSAGETSPALLFISPKLRQLSFKFSAPEEPKAEFEYYSMVEQSDLAPTIAALLGFPVPKNNLGAIIKEFLPLWPKTSDKLQILMRNARQILQIITTAFGPELFDPAGQSEPCTLMATDVNELACQWRSISKQASSLANSKELDHQWLSSMTEWLRRAQDLMSSMASNYDMRKLYLGLGLAVVGLLASVVAVGLMSAERGGALSPLLFTTVLHGAMMFASSYVEEEQHFWYWATSLWLGYLGAREVRRYVQTRH